MQTHRMCYFALCVCEGIICVPLLYIILVCVCVNKRIQETACVFSFPSVKILSWHKAVNVKFCNALLSCFSIQVLSFEVLHFCQLTQK